MKAGCVLRLGLIRGQNLLFHLETRAAAEFIHLEREVERFTTSYSLFIIKQAGRQVWKKGEISDLKTSTWSIKTLLFLLPAVQRLQQTAAELRLLTHKSAPPPNPSLKAPTRRANAGVRAENEPDGSPWLRLRNNSDL